MSRIEGILELAISPDRAQSCCRQAFADLDWSVTREHPGLLEAREGITRLSCHQSPAEAQLRIEESESGCALTIATKVPGFGPISASHAHGRQEAIVRRVHSRATAGPPQAATANPQG